MTRTGSRKRGTECQETKFEKRWKWIEQDTVCAEGEKVEDEGHLHFPLWCRARVECGSGAMVQVDGQVRFSIDCFPVTSNPHWNAKRADEEKEGTESPYRD